MDENSGTQQQSSGEKISDVALAYMRTTSSRLDKTEGEFVEHLQRVEGRLDQLIDFMRDIAVLQQQYTTQGEALGELRVAVREQSIRLENSVRQVHSRLDDLTTTMTVNIDSETSKIVEKLNEYEVKHKILDHKFHTWLNRGLGGLAAVAVVCAVFQFTGVRWLERLETERVYTAERVTKIQNRVTDLENAAAEQTNVAGKK